MEYSNSFENHLREQGKAEKTIQSYTGGGRLLVFSLK